MYLDPGFGTMLIQFIVAAVAACGAYAVIFRNRIKAFFNKKKGVTEDATTEAVEATEAAEEAAAKAKERVEALSSQFAEAESAEKKD